MFRAAPITYLIGVTYSNWVDFVQELLKGEPDDKVDPLIVNIND